MLVYFDFDIKADEGIISIKAAKSLTLESIVLSMADNNSTSEWLDQGPANGFYPIIQHSESTISLVIFLHKTIPYCQ